jgi:hypothetical protein
MDELLLTLVRLRLGFLNADLAYRFHISAKHVSTIVLTWIQFLYKRFSDLKISISLCSKVAWLLRMNFRVVINATNILVLFKALW